VSRCSGSDHWQQRQDDGNQWKHEARHRRTIGGRLSGGDSNLSAQSMAARLFDLDAR
jgi:hypothetical protein